MCALTVAQLLGMVSGIPDFADAAVAADHAKSFTREDDIALGLSLGTPKPAGTPGYSTTNIFIMGVI